MARFVIRSQGFFYTDEYYAPAGVERQTILKTFATRAEAESAARAHCRKWLREAPNLTDFVFDDSAATAALERLFAATWPERKFDEYRLEMPGDATDPVVDAIAALLPTQLCSVYEVSAREEAADPDDGSPIATEDESEDEDELWFGPAPDRRRRSRDE